MSTALIIIISIITVYFAITKFSSLCEKDLDNSLESISVMTINQVLGESHDYQCTKVTIEPFQTLYDCREGDEPVSSIITATIYLKGSYKEYSVLTDSCEPKDLKAALYTIIDNVKKDIADAEIAC